MTARHAPADRLPLLVTQAGARPRASFYVPELDGLRALAFLAVFVHHASPVGLLPRLWLRWDDPEWWVRAVALSGVFGVDLFFVLSGFLITTLLLRETDATGRIDVPAFWARRALRIWPLYFVYVGALALVEGLPARTVAAYSLFVGNWSVAGGAPAGSLIGVLWSVQIEEQFYVVWPLLLMWVPRRWLPAVCVGAIAAALVLRGALLADGAGLRQIWFPTLARLDPLAVGALLALGPARLGPALRAFVGAGSALLIVAMTGFLANEWVLPGTLTIRPGWSVLSVALLFPVVALACGGILWAALSARDSWLAHPALVALGRISYGLYVVHLASLRLLEPLWWPWRGVLALAVSVAIASLSYRFLERPFLRLKARFTYIGSAPLAPRP